MGDGNLIAVSDAGPLIHLAEVNCLAFLDLFTRLHIPELVGSEIIRQPQITNTDFTIVSNIQRHDLSRAAVAEFVARAIVELAIEQLHQR